MCSPAACRQCGGVTWSGCGSHVDQVMSRVPAERHCRCGEVGSSSGQQAPARRKGLFRR